MMSNHVAYRYERKFIIPNEDIFKVKNYIRDHPMLFSRQHADRVVNNIYMDSINMDSYSSHVEGSKHREKIRLRWYGKEQNVLPILEIKIKNGNVGYKQSIELRKISITDIIHRNEVMKLLKKSEVVTKSGIDIRSLIPIIKNSYTRSYWISADGRYRVTIDNQIVSESISGRQNIFYWARNKHGVVVVELKYTNTDQNDANVFGQYIPWLASRYSKYVTGVDLLRSRSWGIQASGLS